MALPIVTESQYWAIHGGEPSMTNNERLARRWFAQVWGERRETVIDELMSEDCVGQTEGGRLLGRQAWKDQVYAPFVAAMPDLRLTVEGTVCEGEQVVVRWIATGTHSGDGFGFAPCQRQVRFRGMTWLRLVDGQIVEGADSWNQSGLMATLGAGALPSAEVLN